MKKTWITISAKFESLNQRERWMVTCALFVTAFALIDSLLISPVLTHQKILNSEIAADEAQIHELTQQMNAFANKPVIDPDAPNRKHIADLSTLLKVQDAELNSLQTTLISPEKMPELLRSLLKKNGNLKLIALKTLPTKGLLEDDSDEKNATTPTDSATESATVHASQSNKADAPVFKHGVKITVEGHYLDLVEYVSELEKMPWHVLWRKAALNTDPTASTWPDNRLTLTVYTLSLDKTWLTL